MAIQFRLAAAHRADGAGGRDPCLALCRDSDRGPLQFVGIPPNAFRPLIKQLCWRENFLVLAIGISAADYETPEILSALVQIAKTGTLAAKMKVGEIVFLRAF
jgi:hypothetical protein